MFQAIVQQLGEHLQRDDDRRAFVLIDPLLREPFPTGWEPAAQARSWPIPVRHAAMGQQQRPRLLELDTHNVALLQASVVAANQELREYDHECSQGYCIGGWLLADATTQGATLARHLASCMQTWSTAAHRNVLIRWPDRRVLEWIWPVLSAAQQARLLEPLIDWSVLDRRGRLQTYRAPPQTEPAPYLRLSPSQWRHAEYSQTAQDLLRGWLAYTDELPADYLRRLVHAMDAIDDTGLTARQDQALLGSYILQIHPQLTAHPRVRIAIDCVVRDECTLLQALESIPDPDGWNAIRDELTHSTFTQARVPHRSTDHG